MTTPSSQHLKVFLCHSSGDKPVVRELYWQLRNEDWIDPWLDEMNLLPGQEWDIEIEKAVEAADIVLVCLSAHSVDREGYVQKELRFVLNIADEKPEGSIFVIPLRLDDCVVPRRLRHWQWVDYFPREQKTFANQRLFESFRVRAKKLGIFDNDSKAEPVQKSVEKIRSEPLPDTSFDAVRKEIKPLPRRKLPQSFVEQVKKYEAEQLQLKKKASWRLVAGITGGILLIAFLVWGEMSIWNNLSSTALEPTRTFQPVAKNTSQPAKTNIPSPTQMHVPPTPMPAIGKDGMTLLYVPAGEFMMGNEEYYENEQPVHIVYLDAFWIDQTEVTNAMYVHCVEAGICSPPISIKSETRSEYYGNPDFDNYPVIFANWNMAKAYCNWVERRLPTEAEWEKAARGPDGYVYPWGNESPAYNSSNYNDRLGDTTEVDDFPQGKSFYGALNMAGNVWEWVNSLYRPYPYDITDGRESLISSDSRVLRGGSYLSSADLIRSTVRLRGDLTYSSYYGFGFRCAMDVTP